VTNLASRLVPRLIAIQLGVGAAAALVVVAFAPRLLLLDSAVVAGTIAASTWAAVAMAAFAGLATLVVTRPLRPALAALGGAGREIDRNELLAIYALPARLAAIDVLGAFAISSATLIPPLRPATNDLPTQAALVLLTMTMVCAASLPLYVMIRVSVGRVLELASVEAAREAIASLEKNGRRIGRLRKRLIAAVAAPVAFVALGASLLVYAHARAQDGAAREAVATLLARGTLDLVDGDETGRREAMAVAAAAGYSVEIDRAGVAPPVSPGTAAQGPAILHDDDGTTRIAVPLEVGQARVHFATTRVNPVLGVYVLLAAIATALAGILGMRIGVAFSDDVALATHETKHTGVADVIRGTRVPRGARFSSVATLMGAIDELGGVFREFASAQERAILAHAATERMRGLFLASMSHDLKGPLNSILGFAELVLRGDLTEAQRESIAIIEQRGRELLTLIQVILDSARVEAGELQPANEWTMVGDVVMSAVLEARELAAFSDVQVVGEIQPGVPRLFCDPLLVTQALTQVISSAVRFTEKGTVFVRATVPAPADRLRIDVETSGRGIPQTELERVFEAFKHTDRARRHGSLGLGLSLARSIVELHKGSIEIDAVESGGPVFHVWMPAGDRSSVQRLGVRPV
jgi:signal transduction histidine kinase